MDVLFRVGAARRATFCAATSVLLIGFWGYCSRAETPSEEASATNTPTAAEMAQAIEQLDAESPERRDAAERQLIAWSPTSSGALGKGAGDAYLSLLPESTPQMSAETRMRLQRIRRTLQSHLSRRVATPTQFSIDVTDAPLDDVLAEIERQTGNQLVDYREQFGQTGGATRVTFRAQDALFWQGLDDMLDAVAMTPYASSGDDGLGLVNRDGEGSRRSGKAAYAGPFRVEAVKITARRDLRAPQQSQLQIELEYSWEPRIKPIFISQSAVDLHVRMADGLELPLASPQTEFNIDPQPGSHAAELVIPVRLPARRDVAIASLSGQFTALVPAQVVEFEFDRLRDAQLVEQTIGGVNVVVQQVRQNGALWEIYMRISVQGSDAGLAAHRGWVFNNLSTLKSRSGDVLDNAGFETIQQTETETGIAYFFDIPPETSIEEYKWVYRSPAAITHVPITYELQELLLP